MSIEISSRCVSRWLALGALMLAVAGSAFGQQEANQEKESTTAAPTSGQDAVLVALVEPGPAPATATAPAPMAPSSAMAPSFSWTGFYAGINIGGANGNGDTSVTPLPTAAQFVNLLPQTLHPDPGGVVGGGQFGFNLQRGVFVIGGEFDLSGSGIDGTKTVAPITQNNGTPFPGAGNHITVQQNTSWFGTIRGRLGIAPVPRLLIYGTGGLAFGHVNGTADTDFRPTGTEHYPASFDETKSGFAAGAGAELAFGHRWSVRGEYLHFDLGSTTVTANPAIPLPPFQVRYVWETTANVYRFGLNFKF
jgi:outer membrane immunogenic protein